MSTLLRMLRSRWLGLAVSAAVVLHLASMVRDNLRRPPYLGVRDGRLPACRKTPNGVSSQATDVHRIAPLRFTSSPDQAMQDLLRVLSDTPRMTVVTADSHYIHAEARSAVFRFVDDLEFYLNTDMSQIECRSFARVGYSDMGVNRRRVEDLRQRLDAAQASH